MVQSLVEKIQGLKVSELVSLNEELMKAFGIDKSMLSAAPAAAPSHHHGHHEAPAAAEKTSFDVKLKGIGGAKLAVIKVVKEKLGNSLAEAKALVESCDGGKLAVIKSGLSKDEAEALKKDLVDAGADAICE
jgi:large subunit ribosomal protein L7/L12